MKTEVLPLNKEADTDYPVHRIIHNRWSPRSFSNEPVDKDLLLQLFEAARWSPSSYNEQPWRFIIATKEQSEEYKKLSQVLNEFNRKWAITAPVLILTVVKEYFEKNGKPNRAAEHDLGAAMSYLTFEATNHNLYVHQMAGILPEKAKELYEIPEGYKPFTMATVGYPGEPEQLPDDLAQKEYAERKRKPLDELVFRKEWGLSL